MVVLAWRVAATAVAASLAAAAWFFAGGPADQQASLGQSIAALSQAKSIELMVTEGDTSHEAWAVPGKLRWNLGEGQYRIARGDRVWTVDERANRAASSPAALFQPETTALNPLALLLATNVLGAMDDKAQDELLAARPSKQVDREGASYDFYAIPWRGAEGAKRIEAWVDRRTGCLHTIEVLADRNGKFTSLAAVKIVAVDKPVAEDLFVVGDTLTEDGRIGKVIDSQGIAAVKPAAGERFTPLADGLLLMPGDWVRTDVRGANAVAMRLVRDVHVTIGPGALVELTGPTQLRVFSGDVKVAAHEKTPLEIIAPDRSTIRVADTQIFRATEKQLERLPQPPRWLEGFEGQIAGESIGSLVANIEGRNTPLTVGYHKVSVDIRDQIARTVVEQSFVNHTNGRLEGVFHFPLPQDASISGFGMWIGDELVEADVVEKQRAREIYEEILRERRDPGLLEWTGGNIFKARVFPIEAHSEKRIKITYTQVLPLRGTTYRYSYALQSELLRQHPLRELSIDVRLDSVVPLKTVNSPTHPVRLQQTKHSARAEFTAQQYTPTRDFEVVVEPDGPQNNLVLIPHRRGDDGYFMALLTPPALEGAGPRELLPEGEPLNLLVVADTSASIDRGGRTAQAEFIAALLGSLTPRDRFNLAAADVETDWVFDGSQAADEKNVAAARQFLAGRVSLGWTDLDKAFASALSKAKKATRVVYVGDGIVTTGDADPVAFANRLKRMYAAQDHAATCYAVSVSSSYESGVLGAIASLGGGSMRAISGELSPSSVARELLGEFSRPALRDLAVEFRGLRVARVYPDPLPNVAAGTQQIILGRYLPESGRQEGEIVVSGTFEGKPLRLASRAVLPAAEEGNSFIPRLWARMHLDFLLQQGTAQAVQDDIIALSEEYHIITPYTSLLVLESDADRERFKVQRRFLMRDGEKFFAEGRDNANFALQQQQMRRAGGWRTNLRRSVLSELGGLGRDAEVFDMLPNSSGMSQLAVDYSGFGLGWDSESGFLHRDGGTILLGGMMRSSGGGMGGMGGGAFGPMGAMAAPARPMTSMPTSHAMQMAAQDMFYGFDGDIDGSFDFKKDAVSNEMVKELSISEKTLTDSLSAEVWDEELSFEMPSVAEPMFEAGDKAQRRSLGEPLARREWNMGERLGDRRKARLGISLNARMPSPANKPASGLYYGGYAYQTYGDWLGQLFPALGTPPSKETEPTKPWPADARAIAQSLLRRNALRKLEGGVEIVIESESFEPRDARKTSESRTRALYGPRQWLVEQGSFGAPSHLEWCDGRERGVVSLPLGLGRTRKEVAEDLDLRGVPMGLEGYVVGRLDLSYAGTAVELKPQGDDRVLLVIRYDHSPTTEQQMLVDTKRHVVLWVKYLTDGATTAETRYGDFFEFAGAWWTGKRESFDAKGRRTGESTTKFVALTAEELAGRTKDALASNEQVAFLVEPLPSLIEAKRAAGEGKATFTDQMMLAVHFSQAQQWTKVFEHFEAAEKLSGKPGLRWVNHQLLNMARRREHLREQLMSEAARLAKEASPHELYLAERIANQASSILEINEQMQLYDTLLAVYQRAPAFSDAMKRWRQNRVTHLQNTGQPHDALVELTKLAADYPLDYSLQQQLANALAGVGEHEAAYRLLREALDGKRQWLPYEEQSLRGAYSQLLQNQGKWKELVEWLAAWMAQKPETSMPYEQYLGALARLDRMDEVNAKTLEWLEAVKTEPKPSADTVARAQAAIALMLGQSSGWYNYRIDERWMEPLAETAIAFAAHDTQSGLADRIMSTWQFTQTDAARRVRLAALDILLGRRADGPKLEDLRAADAQRLVSWAIGLGSEVDEAAWRKIADRVRPRWQAEEKTDQKYQWANLLLNIYGSRLAGEPHLALLRELIAKSEEPYRLGYVQQLFSALLTQPWTAEREDEAMALIDRQTTSDEPFEQMRSRLAALHRLADAMAELRYAALVKELKEPEKLTRIELRQKQADARREAQRDFAKRLHRAMAEREGTAARWFNAERIYLELLAGGDLEKIADECWEMLGSRPAKKQPAADANAVEVFDELLQGRLLTMLAHIAARRGAPDDTAKRVLEYIDARLAESERDDPTWRLARYQVLVALDRPKELEASLRQWIGEDGPVNHWRLTLGYLLAEQGKLAEAIALFEAIRTADELGPAEHRTLADWYLAVDRRDDHRRAMIAAYQTIEDYNLSNLLYQHLRPWQQSEGQAPSVLSDEVLLIFAALFEKSSQPHQYLYQLQSFYRETRDFRLLANLPDAVVGHTAGRVYPFLQNLSGVLSEVRDEATADSIVEQTGKIRPRATTDIDRRALDLMELLVERRAAEVLNQPGPHVEKAMSAMQRAFKRQWSPGEPRLMADLLASLGQISQQPLADEQTRQIESLYNTAEPKTIDRLHIAMRLANVRWSYGKQDGAIDVLRHELGEYRAAHGDALRPEANEAFGTLVGYYESRGHHAQGEQLLLAELKAPLNAQQGRYLKDRLYQLYERAIRDQSTISLGSGNDLFRAAVERVGREMDTDDPSFRNQLVERMCGIFLAAKQRQLDGAADALRVFAFGRFREVIDRELNQRSSQVTRVAQTLREVIGPLAALELLVVELEEEPAWLRMSNQGGWNQYGWSVAQWRSDAKQLGELEPRLLKVVLTELREDLRTRQQRSRSIYHRHHGYYWAEKEADFARVAEEFYQDRKQSGAAVRYIAEYLFRGLDHHDRAIEMLQVAWRDGLLDESAQSLLAQYLHERLRHGESIAVLLPMVEKWPDNIQYRVWLMHAYFRTRQPASLLALLEATDERFRQGERWTEDAMAALAHSCLENELFERSVKYYGEVIPLHQRTQPNRGIGNGTLSNYFANLARAHAGLKQTAEAVEAATGAIVSWGPRHDERSSALQALLDIVRDAPNLDDYVKRLDAEAEKTGLHNPVVRKAIGQVYLERQKFDEAIAQLTLAVELQPNDTETHKALVEAYDRKDDKPGALARMLESIQLTRRDIELYKDLGHRFERQGEPQQAERAFTSIVEMLPNESEGHAALAELRQEQNRWPAAIEHWKQVARIRALEPTGLLELAAAQIHEKQWDAADATLRKLEARSWPSRFNDAENKIRRMRQQVQARD